jgi:hypothetical protein
MDRIEAFAFMIRNLTQQEKILLLGKILATIFFLSAFPVSLVAGGGPGLFIAAMALLLDFFVVIYGTYTWISGED